MKEYSNRHVSKSKKSYSTFYLLMLNGFFLACPPEQDGTVSDSATDTVLTITEGPLSTSTTTAGESDTVITTGMDTSPSELCGNGMIDPGEDCDPNVNPGSLTKPSINAYCKKPGDENECTLDARIVFLTSEAITFGGEGGLKSIAEAHQKCNKLAEGSTSLAVQNRRFMAWLGTNEDNIEHFDPCKCFNPELKEATNFILTDGRKVAGDWKVIEGLEEHIAYPINMDENQSEPSGANYVWSNVKAGHGQEKHEVNGVKVPTVSCERWTGNPDPNPDPDPGLTTMIGRVGDIDNLQNYGWSYTSEFDTKHCSQDDEKVYMYCFEQCNTLTDANCDKLFENLSKCYFEPPVMEENQLCVHD